MTALRFQIGSGEGVERGEIRHAQTSFEGYKKKLNKNKEFSKAKSLIVRSKHLKGSK